MNKEEIVNQIAKLKIAVVGDFILDKYIVGYADRLSPEAPVIVVNKTDEYVCLGGAANVWQNLRGMGVDAYLFCDGDPADWTKESGRVFVNPNAYSIKTRVIARNHQLLRIDEEPSKEEILWGTFRSLEWANDFQSRVLDGTFNCVVISDYHKGVVSKSVAEMVVALCQDKNIPCIVNAKRDFGRFIGSTLVQCNAKEFNGIENIWDYINQQEGPKHFIVTQGENGIDVYTRFVKRPKRFTTEKIQAVDVSGAGDTVVAVYALLAALDADVHTATVLANKLAAIACKHMGIYSISQSELLEAL